MEERNAIVQRMVTAELNVRPRVDKSTWKHLQRYLHDNEVYRQQYQRSVQYWKVGTKCIIGAATLGFCSLITGFIVGLTDGRAHYAALEAWIAIWGGLGIFLAAIVAGLCYAFSLANYSITDFLQNRSAYYLPNIIQKRTDDTLTISLVDNVNNAKTVYAERSFTAGDTVAALEYQVELESMIEEVLDVRANQYAQACLNSRMELLAAQPAQLQTTSDSFEDEDEEKETLDDMEAVLKQQRRAITFS